MSDVWVVESAEKTGVPVMTRVFAIDEETGAVVVSESGRGLAQITKAWYTENLDVKRMLVGGQKDAELQMREWADELPDGFYWEMVRGVPGGGFYLAPARYGAWKTSLRTGKPTNEDMNVELKRLQAKYAPNFRKV